MTATTGPHVASPLMRTVGTVLLGIGFTMLAMAILIRDPTALDANIGAGFLSLLGIPVGALGLVLIVVHAVTHAADRSRRVPKNPQSPPQKEKPHGRHQRLHHQ